MDFAKFEPLRIRTYLRTGVVSDAYLPLDGILFYQSVRQDLGAQTVTVPGASLLAQPKGETMRGGKLPMKTVHGKEWYYRCSWAQWSEPVIEYQDHWNKRFDNPLADLIDFRGKRGKVIIEQSTYKAYHMPVFVRTALFIDWYLVGDKDLLDELLASVTHIGKKTSQGFGRVKRWEIRREVEDWSVWKGNKLMRGIPLWDKPRGYQAEKFGLYGIRPSYWDRRNQVQLVLP